MLLRQHIEESVGSLIGTMGIVTLLPFVQVDGLWKCIYDTFPGRLQHVAFTSFGF